MLGLKSILIIMKSKRPNSEYAQIENIKYG